MKVIDPTAMIKEYLRGQDRLIPSETNLPQEMHKAILEGAARCLNDIMVECDFCWAESVSEDCRSDKVSAVMDAVEKIELESWARNYSRDNDIKTIMEFLQNLQQQ